MLKIIIPKQELYKRQTREFIQIEETVLNLEHSLVSIQKWESIFHKPFMSETKKTVEESVEYIKCMTLNEDVNPSVYLGITNAIMKQVDDYMLDGMTATWFSDNKKPKTGKKEIVTAEIIYYWMISFNIPSEYRFWHLNQLITLIKVCEAKQEKPKPLKGRSLAKHNAAINAARKARLHTNG